MTTLVAYPVTVPARRLEGPGTPAPGAARHRSGRLRRLLGSSGPWLGLVAAGQVVLSRVVPGNPTAFQDEGLYIYMGHRVLADVFGGTPLFEFPGSYFSGAPGFYPVLASLADSVGGLQAVRDLSLAFVVVTMVAVAGIGRELFGRLAGVLAAGVFAVCGSVVYLSQWATFDSLTLMLAALATWLAVASATRDGLLRAPFVALLLTGAVFAKYAGASFVPVVAALAVAVAWPRYRWLIVRRAVFLVAASVSAFFFVLLLFGRGLVPGLAQTTTERHILNPESAPTLALQVVRYIGPWLLLAGLGGLARLRRQPAVVLVLLGGSLLAPLQQIHLGEATSLSKHVAFGLIFAAPLIGDLFARLLRWRLLVAPLVLAAVAALTLHGMHFGGQFRTAYPQDSRFQAILRQAVAANAGQPILAEQSSAQRYELRGVTEPHQWVDTYVFNYGGETGVEAYRRAIQDHYFGVIYLNFTTVKSHQIVKMLGDAQGPDHYYHLVAEVPGQIHGDQAGYWLVWTPQTHHYTPIR